MQSLGRALHEAIRKLIRAPTIDKRSVKELVLDFQRALLQADVNVKLVLELSERIEEQLLKKRELPPELSRREYAIKVIYDELTRLIGKEPQPINLDSNRMNVIMLVGIQGCGKTTSAAKLANFYKRRGMKPVLICADKFRPGAYEQLKQLGDSIGVQTYTDGGNPIEVAKRGIKKYEQEDFNLAIIDTAGRHKEEKGLIEEMRLLAEEIKPDEIILVIDGTIGQQAYAQAKAFSEATNIGSIFVTKLDSSARGGGAISAAAATGAKVKFIGTGEKIDDIELFDPPRFVGRLLGMGDITALLERVKEEGITPSIEQLRSMARKFTIEDMYNQIKSLQKLGPLQKIINLIPGISYSLPEDMIEVAENKLRKWRYIIQSMTKEEKEDPSLMKKRSRVRRIAYGSGVSEKEVDEFIKQYFAMRNLIKRILRDRKKLSFLEKAVRLGQIASH